MQYYFFLVVPNIKPEITVSNFPPAACNVEMVERFICTATPYGNKWVLKTIQSIRPHESYCVNGELLNLDDDLLKQTLVFMSRNPLQGEQALLHVSEDYSCWPEWRANLRINSQYSAASYQGEYPAQMISIKNGTLVTVVSMLQNSLDVQNKFLFVNFTEDPLSRAVELEFYRLRGMRLIKKVSVFTNQISCIDLSDISLEGDGELILVTSKDAHGIPIYFSHSTDYKNLSLEHTHPPTEMTVFGAANSRFLIAKKMKNFWLGRNV